MPRSSGAVTVHSWKAAEKFPSMRPLLLTELIASNDIAVCYELYKIASMLQNDTHLRR